MAQTMMAKVIPELVDMKALQEQQQKKQSVIFLEVPANMATEDAPNNSKRYSNNNSKAANKQSDKETNKPKIDTETIIINIILICSSIIEYFYFLILNLDF